VIGRLAAADAVGDVTPTLPPPSWVFLAVGCTSCRAGGGPGRFWCRIWPWEVKERKNAWDATQVSRSV